MDELKLQKTVASFGEQLLILDQQLANLRASVNVLKIYVAFQMFPDDVVEGLAQLRRMEQVLLDADPQQQERQNAADVVDALKKWKKMGGGHHRA